jgi:hypothetical protein
MATPQWVCIRRFKRGNGIQKFTYEEIGCSGCENKCQRIINLSEDELRPASCQKDE